MAQAAVEATGLAEAPRGLGLEPLPEGRPALLTDNGSGYISEMMEEYLRTQGRKHLRAQAHHPQTSGKIERMHRTLKGNVTLVVRTAPGELRGEACSIVAIEAMAAGRPVVASRAGGLQFSVVDGLTGYLFAPGNAGELAERLEVLLDDAARRKQMGAAARARAQQFDWRRLITERYLPWLADGLSGQRPDRAH